MAHGAVWSGILAGMRPAPTLTELAKFRLHTLSFFLIVILVSAAIVRLLWNYLRKDFTRLPRLSYPKAIAIVVLWGLMFVIVLAMISGARELMTPGAWAPRAGGGYELTDADFQILRQARRQQIELLRTALWRYAQSHGGKLPPHEFVPDIPEGLWQLNHPSHMRYVYIAGRQADRGDLPVAYEPDVYGDRRLVILSSGQVEEMHIDAITTAIERAE